MKLRIFGDLFLIDVSWYKLTVFHRHFRVVDNSVPKVNIIMASLPPSASRAPSATAALSADLASLAAAYRKNLETCKSIEELAQLEAALLGKTGKLKLVLKSLGTLPPDDRKVLGGEANLLKVELTDLTANARERLLEKQSDGGAKFDLTLPGKKARIGGMHPISRTILDLNESFLSLGFEVFEGPEVSSEAFVFDSLNFPDYHPARESMDTYWLAGSAGKKGVERLCLRPHLTGASVRYMLSHTPPFRFVYPGNVFRNESTDASHERAFVQYEALIVDRQVPFSAVRHMVDTILERVFGRPVVTRMRAGFFPFVEPGFEIDMRCLVCDGKGCSVCKRVGWLEVMPGGPPHPNVLRAGGIDPEKWQGAYINIGIDRILMMKYGIDDVRLFHSSDLSFLTQFNS